ncbi:MAG: glycosyltransferase family 2 protein [Desulfitobacteriaceae bacterium]
MPSVSVVIPTFNHELYVNQAVESVLAQGYPNVQVLVVDDGSRDNTAAILKPYLSRIQYVYKENGGTSSALNRGLSLANGQYICWLSADDAFLPGKIARQVALMESDPKLGFSYTSFSVIDGYGRKQHDVHSAYFQDKWDMIKHLMEGCFINGSSVMMRRSALERVGGFDEGLPQAHDYDLWFRFLRYYSCGFLDELLLAYRWHGENMSKVSDPTSERVVRERVRRLFPELV